MLGGAVKGNEDGPGVDDGRGRGVAAGGRQAEGQLQPVVLGQADGAGGVEDIRAGGIGGLGWAARDRLDDEYAGNEAEAEDARPIHPSVLSVRTRACALVTARATVQPTHRLG